MIKQAEDRVAVLAIDRVQVEQGHNPRERFDEEEHARLVASIRRHGVLQPLLVRGGEEDDTYVVVAGERRLRAAKAAGLKQVPALVRECANGGALESALVENLVRSELAPVEEAKAIARLKQGRVSAKAVGERIGRTAKHVSERLRLLELPESVQALVDEGELGLAAAQALVAVAKVDPGLCAEVVRHALKRGDAALCERSLGGLLADVQRDPDAQAFCASLAGYGAELPAAAARLMPELAERFEAAFPPDRWGYRQVEVRWEPEDLDAARAYGCLLELGDDEGYGGQYAFVTDAEWYAGRLAEKLDAHAQRREQSERDRVKALADSSGVALEDGASPDAVRDAEAEAKQSERAREQRERLGARAANLELGEKLTRRRKRRLAADDARALATLALEGAGGGAALVERGMRYCVGELQAAEVRTLKSGETREKVEYADSEACAKWVERRLAAATTADEVLDVALKVLAAARYADESCVARSNRSHHWSSRLGEQRTVAAIERAAKGLVPARLVKAAKRGH